MNKQQAIKQLRELRDAHGDVSLPVSRVVTILESLKEPQSNAVTIDRDELVRMVTEQLDSTYKSRQITDFQFSLNGRELDLYEVDIDVDAFEENVKDGVNKYLKKYHPELVFEDA